ncbi:MAG: DUF1659 domain-containing protein [Bacillota bacterium]|nr:DUF1659 domain-containing protein [Bacillota bacterium]
MAVNAVKEKTSMIISYKTGTDEDGKEIIKNQSFSNVKVTSTEDDVFSAASLFSPLLLYPILSIEKQDREVLSQI